MGGNAIRHPHDVAIADPATTRGLRAYAEPEVPRALQLTFLEEAGERAYVDRLRDLLVAGRADEADAIVSGDLAGFDGRIADIGRALAPADVTIEGWGDLLPILDEFEGPAITALTVGLTNELDLVFEAAALHEPSLMLGLYSDDGFAFSTASRDALLAECAADMPGWFGNEEDVEFYADVAGLAALNTALVQCKHRYFLRDGRDDGVRGRAPGGYVEYVLGCWLRAIRFTQALERAIAEHGLPAGARVIAGTVELNADFATVIAPVEYRPVAPPVTVAAPMAALTIKPWVAHEDPTQPEPATGSTLRQRLIEPAPEPEPEPVAVAAESEPSSPPRFGFLARLFGRR